jgi:hypothetical protein
VTAVVPTSMAITWAAESAVILQAPETGSVVPSWAIWAA